MAFGLSRAVALFPRDLSFDNTFQKLPPILFETVEPTPLRNPRLASTESSLVRQMGFDGFGPELVPWLNGEARVPGDQRIATRYAGHQFGYWAGQLGDGRAISLGEFRGPDGARWEVQTKGSGQTPFSRRGDGKAVVRSSVREYLCSEHMHALGIPTTRALALVIGDDPVRRETIEGAALVARAFPSNLRFGHFEYLYHFDHPAELAALADYTRTHFFPDCATTEEMLLALTLRTADLIARWMCVGFSHGVMNSDNMSALGITIDYGPFGFMEDFAESFVCNHSDDGGRYSYRNQPGIALWNLDRLFLCFTNLVPREKLAEILSRYEERYLAGWLEGFRAKLGLRGGTDDAELLVALLAAMEKDQADFTHTFLELARGGEGIVTPELRAWLPAYAERLRAQGESWPRDEGRAARLARVNPRFVLRNYIAQEAIEATERGDFGRLEDWRRVLTNPFDEHPGFEKYQLPPAAKHKNLSVSCSS